MGYNSLLHPGISPIRVLQHNIVYHLENFKPDITKMFQNDVIKNQIVAPEIYLDCRKERIVSPYVDCRKKIVFQETFLAYIWCMVYYFFTIQEDTMKRIMNGSWAGKLEYNSCFLKNAKDLFDYALSLKKSYSEWDTRLPNPEITASVTEKEWVEKINTLFLDTVTFFFFHEYAHLVNGHLNVFKEIKNKKSDKLSTDEMYELIQAEQEADNFAREVMIGDDDPDFFQLRVTIGILMSHISSLFLINNPIHVSQKTHPDLDDRVFNCIRAFNSSEQKSDFYVKHLAIMALSVFFNNNGYDIPNSEFETIGDCIKKYEEIFDRIKSP